jgi:hypothetical protein
MTKSTFVYVTYITTTPQRLWSALTDDSEFMKLYWFGVHCQSQWTQGASWQMIHADGSISDAGEIVEAVPPSRLVIRWLHLKRCGFRFYRPCIPIIDRPAFRLISGRLIRELSGHQRMVAQQVESLIA